MVRCFVCVEISDPMNIQTIENVLAKLKLIKGIRPVKTNQLHLTLKFLGEISEKKLPRISEQLETIKIPSFSLKFSNIGCFPNNVRPRVIWTGISKGQQELTTLAQEVDTKLNEIGLPKEKRQFSPHLTLGRVKKLTEETKQDIRQFFQEMATLTGEEESIHQFTFKESTLTPTGAIYKDLATIPLIESGEH
ncbi:MAG: RNA 2',3'-cyclic phosphodiesterase [Candidatus Hodarchaeales archaeon]